MFALIFRFPADRYHATPWGRNVNEADVAWPPEPWRLLRALIAAYWRKGNRARWSEDVLARLIDALAETLPVYYLPDGAVQAHTRHYMPRGTLDKGNEKTTLVFDGFVHLPKGAVIVATWPQATLGAEIFALAVDLAASIGYLGRAESWTECQAVDEWNGHTNCGPADAGYSGVAVRVLAPLSPVMYAAERKRLTADAETRIRTKTREPLASEELSRKIAKTFQSKGSKVDTLPARLVNALALDTADYQDRGWSRPPAAREVVYALAVEAAPGVIPRVTRRPPSTLRQDTPPTVARFLLAGRPPPPCRRHDQGWRAHAPCSSGTVRLAEGRRNGAQGFQTHRGRFPAGATMGNHSEIRRTPTRSGCQRMRIRMVGSITCRCSSQVASTTVSATSLIASPDSGSHRSGGYKTLRAEHSNTVEWRLALEGFGTPADFAGSARIFGTSTRWRSITPFLAAGHLKAAGYPGEGATTDEASRPGGGRGRDNRNPGNKRGKRQTPPPSISTDSGPVAVKRNMTPLAPS